MAALTTTRPARKVYTDGAGHTRELHYEQSKQDGSWFPVYAWSGCTDDCRLCNGGEQEDYAGEYWDEE